MCIVVSSLISGISCFEKLAVRFSRKPAVIFEMDTMYVMREQDLKVHDGWQSSPQDHVQTSLQTTTASFSAR